MKLLLVLLILGNTKAEREGQGGTRNSAKTFGNVFADGYVPQYAPDDHSDPLADFDKVPLPKQSRRPYIDDEDTHLYNHPRDEVLLRKDAPTEIVNDTDKPSDLLFDFPTLQELNILSSNKQKFSRGRMQRPKTEQVDPFGDKKRPIFRKGSNNTAQYFAPQNYNLNTEESVEEVKVQDNWTTCDEFSKGASFHPDDIVGVEWVPFFIWSYSDLNAVAIVFRYPTKKLVKEYRLKYTLIIDKDIDWEQHKLLMKEGEMEALLIAVDRTGLFYRIPKLNVPDFSPAETKKLQKLQILLIRIKIVDPYLAFMHCDHVEPYAAIMAPAGQEPSTFKEAKEEAASLQFQGVGLPVKRNVELEEFMTRQEQLSKIETNKNNFFQVPDSLKNERWGPSVLGGH